MDRFYMKVLSRLSGGTIYRGSRMYLKSTTTRAPRVTLQTKTSTCLTMSLPRTDAMENTITTDGTRREAIRKRCSNSCRAGPRNTTWTNCLFTVSSHLHSGITNFSDHSRLNIWPKSHADLAFVQDLYILYIKIERLID